MTEAGLIFFNVRCDWLEKVKRQLTQRIRDLVVIFVYFLNHRNVSFFLLEAVSHYRDYQFQNSVFFFVFGQTNSRLLLFPTHPHNSWSQLLIPAKMCDQQCHERVRKCPTLISSLPSPYLISATLLHVNVREGWLLRRTEAADGHMKWMERERGIEKAGLRVGRTVGEEEWRRFKRFNQEPEKGGVQRTNAVIAQYFGRKKFSETMQHNNELL